MTKHCTKGHNTYGNPEVINYHPNKNKCHCYIGNYTSIANNVTILLYQEHHHNKITTHPLFNFLDGVDYPPVEMECNVKIGSDVWIGYGATILSPCTIGDGAIIGANTTITKDIPAYAVVIGNPPKILRYRFNKKDRERLLKLEWWNLPDEQVTKIAPLLYSDDVDSLELACRGTHTECGSA